MYDSEAKCKKRKVEEEEKKNEIEVGDEIYTRIRDKKYRR